MTELLITIRGRVVRTAPDNRSRAAAIAGAMVNRFEPKSSRVAATAQAALEGPK